ncbi:protein transport protein HofC [Winslowiella iniecta]|uniref:Type IV pilin biogenesis protein n=1 Tax=Winslowiella iniecta TaxID=1560201 RepID=A0A0L7T0E6_9GAMM|nr:protein transport protein HofC [Winslowiella iniecta]KOC88929.1 type IV pilin biogenesis protein [Winslowiella iniecta]KOC92256.1 type IV pilin biogenesis protein [Winslowiella iniecta]
MAKHTLFSWQAIDARGDFIAGSQLSDNSLGVMQTLMDAGCSPVRIKAGKTYRPGEWQWQQKIMLIRQLATLLKAGMTLSQGLTLLADGHPHPGWQALLLDIQVKVEQGEPFSQVLNRWPEIFPPLFPALMHVGEVTGQLDECCFQLATQQERQQQLQKKVVKALRYPLFILAVALAVTIGMLVFVLPEFVSIYAVFDTPLPAFTAAVMTLSVMLQSSIAPLTVGVVIAGWFWRSQRKKRINWQRNEQRLLLRVPLISRLYRGSQLSQIFTTLTLTQRAGLTLLQSLEAVEQTLSHCLWREAIVQLQQHIAAGKPLHQALVQHQLFTPLCHQLIKVGEEAGSLDVLLARLAQWHEDQTHELADSLAATLEPLMMVVIGLIVGILVVAMYLPIFGLGDALG